MLVPYHTDLGAVTRSAASWRSSCPATERFEVCIAASESRTPLEKSPGHPPIGSQPGLLSLASASFFRILDHESMTITSRLLNPL